MNDFNEKLWLQIHSIKRILILCVICLAGILSINVYYLVRDVSQKREQYAREQTFEAISTKLAEEALSINSDEKWRELLKLCKARHVTHPKDASAYWMAGQAFFYMNDYTNAILFWQKAAELRPGELRPGWEEDAEKWSNRARQALRFPKKPG